MSLVLPHFLPKYFDESLENIHAYAWAKVIHKYMYDKIPNIACKLQKMNRGEAVNVGYLKGCITLLCVWFLKLTKIELPSHYSRYSRILNWDNILLRRSSFYADHMFTIPNIEICLHIYMYYI